MEFIEDNTVEKIKLLFVLERMEIPLTENNIIDICTSSNKWFKYLDLKEAMFQLIEIGFIFENKIVGEEARYSITTEGRECLSHFYYRIPQNTRENIIAYVQENRMSLKRSQEYVSDYKKNDDGSYYVILKIEEPALTSSLLEIKLKSPNRKSAISTAKKWIDKAPSIYENIFDNLLDE